MGPWCPTARAGRVRSLLEVWIGHGVPSRLVRGTLTSTPCDSSQARPGVVGLEPQATVVVLCLCMFGWTLAVPLKGSSLLPSCTFITAGAFCLQGRHSHPQVVLMWVRSWHEHVGLLLFCCLFFCRVPHRMGAS